MNKCIKFTVIFFIIFLKDAFIIFIDFGFIREISKYLSICGSIRVHMQMSRSKIFIKVFEMLSHYEKYRYNTLYIKYCNVTG